MADNDAKLSLAKGPQPISLRTIFDAVSLIKAAGKEVEFLNLARQKKITIMIEEDVINETKQFLSKISISQSAFGLNASSLESTRNQLTSSPNGRCPEY